MKTSPQTDDRLEDLPELLAECFTVDGTRPVVTLNRAAGWRSCVTIDFRVPCEPPSQTAIQLSLAEALRACRTARPSDRIGAVRACSGGRGPVRR